MANHLNYSADYEKLFFLYSLKNPKYFKTFFHGFFTNDEIDILANMSKGFFDEFQEIPSKDQLKLLIEKSKYSEKVPKDIIDIVFETNLDEYDEEWLKQISESWIKWRNFDKQLIKTLQYVKLQDVSPEKVDGIINNAISMISEKGQVSFESDMGLDFFDTGSHEQHVSNKISSGITFLDRLTGGGYDPRSLVVYAGEQNIGKSIWLANDAANFVRMGKNVVFISAEMADYKVVKRVGSNLLNIQMSEYDKKSRDKGFIQRRLERVGSGVLPPGKLWIHQVPTSQASVIDVESYLRNLEETMDEKIQVVIIDYINILMNYRNPNTENTYMKIKQIAEDLRGMAVRNELLVISATQINRGGWDATDLKMENIAESAGLSHTADIVYGIIQDQLMHGNKEYWLKVLKMRDGEGKGTKCRFEIDYNFMRLTETGDITQISDM